MRVGLRKMVSSLTSGAMIGALTWALAPGPLAAEPAVAAANATIDADMVRKAGGEIYTFYAERGYRPLWLDGQGQPGPGAQALLELLATASIDGIDPARLDLDALKAAIASAQSRSPADVTRAEILTSNAFVTYVQMLRTTAGDAMTYEHPNLRPQSVPAYHILKDSQNASSLGDYVAQMRWMHPLYATLRGNLTTVGSDGSLKKALMSSLARVRGIPNSRRQVVVDVASARLWMYEDGKPVDSMRVVVGKKNTPTPLLAGYIRYAITNPYWNVPSEMVASNIASNVVRRGVGYLRAGGYQVLSDWSANPGIVDPATINWRVAARGGLDLRVRQLPNGGNFMGKAKFEFPNPFGIYLHDTPQKDLMLRSARQFSGGCIRLEDAQRFGRWLMRGDFQTEADRPEVKVDLPAPVPIYITYLTVQAVDGRMALGPDPYGLDLRQVLMTASAPRSGTPPS